MSVKELDRIVAALPEWEGSPAPAVPVAEDHPDVRPWFHTTTEPGPYTEDPEDGYPYDE